MVPATVAAISASLEGAAGPPHDSHASNESRDGDRNHDDDLDHVVDTRTDSYHSALTNGVNPDFVRASAEQGLLDTLGRSDSHPREEKEKKEAQEEEAQEEKEEEEGGGQEEKQKGGGGEKEEEEEEATPSNTFPARRWTAFATSPLARVAPRSSGAPATSPNHPVRRWTAFATRPIRRWTAFATRGGHDRADAMAVPRRHA